MRTPGIVRQNRGWLSALFLLAFLVRVVPPYTAVMNGPGVNFRGNDSWYRMRLVDGLVRHFPDRVTMDPYARPGGEFVAIAPMFDELVAATAWVAGLGSPSAATVDRAGAIVPPLLGAGVAVIVFLLGVALFDRRAGLLGALFVAVAPGPFLERTTLGFADHHAAEVFFSMLAVLAFVRAAEAAGRRAEGKQPPAWLLGSGAGLALGAYLLTWMSGSLLVAALVVWIALQYTIDHLHGRPRGELALVMAPALAVALVLVLAGQDWRTFRFFQQVQALAGALAGVAVLEAARRLIARAGAPGWTFPAALAAGAIAVVAAVAWAMPGATTTLLQDAARFAPGRDASLVVEAQPLLFVNGVLSFARAWSYFGAMLPVGALGLAWLAWRAARDARPGLTLLAVWTAATLVAALGQNRFAYYAAPPLALLTGWVAGGALGWAGIGHGAGRARRRGLADVAVVLVAAAVYMSLSGAVAVARQNNGMPSTWWHAMDWLRARTPEPFGDPGFYDERYSAADATRMPAYSVMSWWDYGYWITRLGRRVPVSNPTQSGAVESADFLIATTEADAVADLDRVNARYVVVDDDLAFRGGGSAPLAGKFEGVVDWTSQPRSRFYQGFFERDAQGALVPVWIFYPDYYRTMAVRLVVYGGAAAEPAGSSYVITYAQRTDSPGRGFREILESKPFATYAEAEAYLSSLGPGLHRLVGRDPRRTCVPLDALERLQLRDRESVVIPHGRRVPTVSIFERVPPAPARP